MKLSVVWPAKESAQWCCFNDTTNSTATDVVGWWLIVTASVLFSMELNYQIQIMHDDSEVEAYALFGLKHGTHLRLWSYTPGERSFSRPTPFGCWIVWLLLYRRMVQFCGLGIDEPWNSLTWCVPYVENSHLYTPSWNFLKFINTYLFVKELSV